ncbi:hypothetical protein P5719_007530 [Lactobacillus amylovorus]|uniref:hypothetical protein n=1 Tax=Lactobacillus amylovorus TaxID=1604 RepID=UPI00313ABA5E|nr:hypothetical protein [Lactobacillus amylovorus]
MKKNKERSICMSKTVREIALAMGVPANDIIKEKQRIRDEIKRQQITVSKSGNKFVIADNDVKKIIEALQGKENEEDSNLNEEKEELLQKIEELKSRNNKLKEDNQSKTEEINLISSQKDEEIRRLNLKIEKFADDFKDLNDKQLQLNNQQQQLQAKILEQTKQLNDSQQQLLDSAEKSSKLQDKVDKMENASLWQRITRKFE